MSRQRYDTVGTIDHRTFHFTLKIVKARDADLMVKTANTKEIYIHMGLFQQTHRMATYRCLGIGLYSATGYDDLHILSARQQGGDGYIVGNDCKGHI